MRRRAHRFSLLAAVASLVAAGCVQLGDSEPAHPVCFRGEPAGEPLSHGLAYQDAPAAGVPRGVHVNRTALQEEGRLRLVASAGVLPNNSAVHRVVVGPKGVNLTRAPDGRDTIRAHFLVEETDAVVHWRQNPRLYVNLSEPLPPGAYRLEACVQDALGFPFTLYNYTTHVRNFTVPP